MAQDLYFTERSASDQYGAMQLPAPVAPTMTTVGLKFDLPPKTKHGYAKTMVQHTPVVVDISGATKARKKRMGTADVAGNLPNATPFVGVVRDQVSLQTVAHQRDPVVAVAVRGILPVAPSAFETNPDTPAAYFKRARFHDYKVKFDAGTQETFGTYLPFGNFAEPYKHAFVFHLNQLSNQIAKTNFLIRQGLPESVVQIQELGQLHVKFAQVETDARLAEAAVDKAQKLAAEAEQRDNELARQAAGAAETEEKRRARLLKRQRANERRNADRQRRKDEADRLKQQGAEVAAALAQKTQEIAAAEPAVRRARAALGP